MPLKKMCSRILSTFARLNKCTLEKKHSLHHQRHPCNYRKNLIWMCSLLNVALLSNKKLINNQVSNSVFSFSFKLAILIIIIIIIEIIIRCAQEIFDYV